MKIIEGPTAPAHQIEPTPQFVSIADIVQGNGQVAHMLLHYSVSRGVKAEYCVIDETDVLVILSPSGKYMTTLKAVDFDSPIETVADAIKMMAMNALLDN